MKILFVQTQPSQIDASFYSLLSQRRPGRVTVALLNARQAGRRDVDPELGFVPPFPAPPTDYRLVCLDRGPSGLAGLLALLRTERPSLVVLQDQTWLEKLRIAVACGRLGLRVAMRSDKNLLSSGARHGVSLAAERLLVRWAFDILVPVSPLTADYYGWRKAETTWPLPYPSLGSKFQPSSEALIVRHRLRDSFGIPADHTVCLAVAKFVERENPAAVIRAFARARAVRRDLSLLLVGAGPLEGELHRLAAASCDGGVHFVGYVPYAQLQEHFFAADLFLHLARREPWGVSVQDALVAGLALVSSRGVGAGLCHLSGDLGRFLVRVDDDDAAALAILELAGPPKARECFSPAWTFVREHYTAEALAAAWSARIGAPQVHRA